MAAPVGEKPGGELRDYLAEERTFLAWIRTGLTLMGFGFVVARFGLFLQLIQMRQDQEGQALPHHGLSPWFGTTFIVVGVLVNLFAIQRHLRLVDELNREQFPAHRVSRMAVILALFLALVGLAMAIYLILA